MRARHESRAVRLGRNQLQRLLGLASPGMLLVVGDDKVSQSLIRRGLIAPHYPSEPRAFLRITSDGMRVLADALEAGHLEQFMKWPERKPQNGGAP